MLKRLMSLITAAALLALPVGPLGVAAAGKPKYAKTEVDKARGKCVGSIIGGALLGALIGRVVDRHGAVTGAALGATAGAGICAVLIANAKHKDQIIAAQLAAAATDGPVVASWTNDEGQPVTFTAQRGAQQEVDGAQLIPVRYSTSGQDLASPEIAPGEKALCRPVNAAFDGGQKAPTQLTCRTAQGNYVPYSYKAV